MVLEGSLAAFLSAAFSGLYREAFESVVYKKLSAETKDSQIASSNVFKNLFKVEVHTI